MDRVRQLGYRPRLILVEEDERLNYEYWCSLGRAGFEVIPLERPSDLGEVLKKLVNVGKNPDVILSDLEVYQIFEDKEARLALRDRVNEDRLLILQKSQIGNPLQIGMEVMDNYWYLVAARRCLNHNSF